MREHGRVDGRLLHDGAVGSQVAVQHAQGADRGERVVVRAHHLAVGRLRAGFQVRVQRAHAGEDAAVEQAQLGQLAHDHRHASHLVQVGERSRTGRRELHEVRGTGGGGIPVVHREGMAGLACDGREVEHRVRGAAEGHVAFHGVVDGSRAHDVAGRDAALQQLHRLHARMLRQADALGVHGRDGAVAGQRDAEGLAEAVHRVRREEPRAAAAGGARMVLVVLEARPRSWCRS